MKRINEGTGLISSLGYRSGALGMRETQYASRLDRKDVRQTEADVGELENESVCVYARGRLFHLHPLSPSFLSLDLGWYESVESHPELLTNFC